MHPRGLHHSELRKQDGEQRQFPCHYGDHTLVGEINNKYACKEICDIIWDSDN